MLIVLWLSLLFIINQVWRDEDLGRFGRRIFLVALSALLLGATVAGLIPLPLRRLGWFILAAWFPMEWSPYLVLIYVLGILALLGFSLAPLALELRSPPATLYVALAPALALLIAGGVYHLTWEWHACHYSIAPEKRLTVLRRAPVFPPSSLDKAPGACQVAYLLSASEYRPFRRVLLAAAKEKAACERTCQGIVARRASTILLGDDLVSGDDGQTFEPAAGLLHPLRGAICGGIELGPDGLKVACRVPGAAGNVPDTRRDCFTANIGNSWQCREPAKTPEIILPISEPSSSEQSQ